MEATLSTQAQKFEVYFTLNIKMTVKFLMKVCSKVLNQVKHMLLK